MSSLTLATVLCTPLLYVNNSYPSDMYGVMVPVPSSMSMNGKRSELVPLTSSSFENVARSWFERLSLIRLFRSNETECTILSIEYIEFAKDILRVITETKNQFGEDKDYSINIEEVPAERAAVILMEKDKIFHPDEIYELPLYGNQWIPLGIKTTLHEKIKLSAVLDKACSGG